MLHRYLAATLGFVILVIGALAWRNRQDSLQPVRMPLAVVALVIFQGLLGMWTVTLLLKPAIVSAHLAGGLTTMALLWWMSLQTTRRSRPHGRRQPAPLGRDRHGGARRADHARRLGQHQLLGRGLSRLPDVPALVLAGHGFQGCVRALARTRHRLRGRRARPPGPRRDPLHASPGRDRGRARPGFRRLESRCGWAIPAASGPPASHWRWRS